MAGRKVWIAAATLGLAVAGLGIAVAPPAGATEVGDEAALRAAMGDPNETKVDLTADIQLADCGDSALDVSRESDTDLTLDGHGHTISQTCDNRVFEIKGAGAFTVQGLTVTGGDATFNGDPSGGGIAHFGPGALNVIDSVISGNNAEGGGAITADGGSSITNSVISNNSALYNSAIDSDVDTTIIGSTIDSNTSTSTDEEIEAGGTVGVDGLITVRNSAVTNNVNPVRSALGSGGGITVINSTVANNTPDVGISTGGPLTLIYATVVDNGSGAENEENIFTFGDLISFGSVVAQAKDGADNCGVEGTVTSNGFNFSDDDSCEFTNAAQGDKESAGDPALGALANNGGRTETRKPAGSSPLKDAIPLASCTAGGASDVTTDQIGTPRPQASGCDIGAVEVAAAAPEATATTTDLPPPSTSASSSKASSSSSGAPIALIVLAVLVIGGIVVALLVRRRRSDTT